MPPVENLPADADAAYHSSEDEDYNPAGVVDDNISISSTSEGEQKYALKGTNAESKKRRKETKDPELGDFGSGDEATIKQGKGAKRRKREAANEGDVPEGGLFVRTRAMRERQEEKKPTATVEGATVDVDALWAKLSSAPIKPPTTTRATQVNTTEPTRIRTEEGGKEIDSAAKGNSESQSPKPKQGTPTIPAEEMTSIKRTYAFAGETMTEEKLVPKSSAEARLYLASQNAPRTSNPGTPPGPPLRRPKRRVSKFEPNPEGIVKGLPPSASKGSKLNTVEKSRLDWAGFVDKEGIKEELDVAGKAKDGYLGKKEFLNRTETKRDEELRIARLK